MNINPAYNCPLMLLPKKTLKGIFWKIDSVLTLSYCRRVSKNMKLFIEEKNIFRRYILEHVPDESILNYWERLWNVKYSGNNYFNYIIFETILKRNNRKIPKIESEVNGGISYFSTDLTNLHTLDEPFLLYGLIKMTQFLKTNDNTFLFKITKHIFQLLLLHNKNTLTGNFLGYMKPKFINLSQLTLINALDQFYEYDLGMTLDIVDYVCLPSILESQEMLEIWIKPPVLFILNLYFLCKFFANERPYINLIELLNEIPETTLIEAKKYYVKQLIRILSQAKSGDDSWAQKLSEDKALIALRKLCLLSFDHNQEIVFEIQNALSTLKPSIGDKNIQKRIEFLLINIRKTNIQDKIKNCIKEHISLNPTFRIIFLMPTLVFQWYSDFLFFGLIKSINIYTLLVKSLFFTAILYDLDIMGTLIGYLLFSLRYDLNLSEKINESLIKLFIANCIALIAYLLI
ncbi:MAG: hypothetical protein C5B43_00120 [Verrucomicrobia bacterium]|nr:MAG: hypothetical protein C5B43_00120 [Verrucomicrobiota bacterium]